MFNILRTLSVFALVMVPAGLFAQTTNGETQITELVKKHVAQNQKKASMPGYRVQIYFGAKRDQATEIKNDFNQKFPDIAAYLLYQQPNFKVRVGDCKTRLEAIKILDTIKDTYEVAFIVKDDVKLPEIN